MTSYYLKSEGFVSQIVIIKIFVIVSNVGMKRVVCTLLYMQGLDKPDTLIFIFCVLFVSKGNLLDFYSYSLKMTVITKTRLFKYIQKISLPKTENFQIKKLYIFHISAQNIDCGYSLEPPRCGGSNEYHNLCFWVEIRIFIFLLKT